MSRQKEIVEEYMEGFRRSDHAAILSCLADDIVWEMPGGFLLRGKEAFDREIENEAFVGRPEIAVHRMVEEGPIVVAEGSVRAARRGGGHLEAVFCDVFTFRNGLIDRLVSYLVETTPADVSGSAAAQEARSATGERP